MPGPTAGRRRRSGKIDNTTLLYAGIYLAAVFISSLSQVLLKKAAGREYKNPLAQYLNPLVILAYTVFVGATLLCMLAYKEIPLSLGPVLEATSYLYVTFFGVTIFGEKLGRQKVLALALILAGIGIYAMG